VVYSDDDALCKRPYIELEGSVIPHAEGVEMQITLKSPRYDVDLGVRNIGPK